MKQLAAINVPKENCSPIWYLANLQLCGLRIKTDFFPSSNAKINPAQVKTAPSAISLEVNFF